MRYALLARYGDTYRVKSDHATHAEAHAHLLALRITDKRLTDCCVVGFEARIQPGTEIRKARARTGGGMSAAQALGRRLHSNSEWATLAGAGMA